MLSVPSCIFRHSIASSKQFVKIILSAFELDEGRHSWKRYKIKIKLNRIDKYPLKIVVVWNRHSNQNTGKYHIQINWSYFPKSLKIHSNNNNNKNENIDLFFFSPVLRKRVIQNYFTWMAYPLVRFGTCHTYISN